MCVDRGRENFSFFFFFSDFSRGNPGSPAPRIQHAAGLRKRATFAPRPGGALPGPKAVPPSSPCDREILETARVVARGAGNTRYTRVCYRVW